jgi:hypothetical protein
MKLLEKARLASLPTCTSTVLEGGVGGAADVSSSPLAICGVMRNEAASLPSWLAYHHLHGVRYVHMYDDGSTDDSVAVLKQVAEAWPSLDVTFEEGAHDQSGVGQMLKTQTDAYTRCLAHFALNVPQVEWVLAIDVDEYVMVNDNKVTLLDALEGRGGEAWDGFSEDSVRLDHPCVNLRRSNYGSAGHVVRPTQPVPLAYPFRDASRRSAGQPKTMVDLGALRNWPNATREFLSGLKVGHGLYGGFKCRTADPHLRIAHYSGSIESLEHLLVESYGGPEGKFGLRRDQPFTSSARPPADVGTGSRPFWRFWSRDSNDEVDVSGFRFRCGLEILLGDGSEVQSVTVESAAEHRRVAGEVSRPPTGEQAQSGSPSGGLAALTALVGPLQPHPFVFIDCGANVGDGLLRWLQHPEEIKGNNTGNIDEIRAKSPILHEALRYEQESSIKISDWRLYGFDGSSAMTSYLKEVADRYEAVTVFPQTLVSNQTEAEHVFYDDSSHPGHNRYGSSMFARREVRGGTKESARAVDFAEFLRAVCSTEKPTGNRDRRCVVKMDIEGAEYPVMHHLMTTDTLCVITDLHLEWHSGAPEGYDEDEIKTKVTQWFADPPCGDGIRRVFDKRTD